MTGLFFALIGAVILNSFLNIGVLGLLISFGIGAFGVFILGLQRVYVYDTRRGQPHSRRSDAVCRSIQRVRGNAEYSAARHEWRETVLANCPGSSALVRVPWFECRRLSAATRS